MPSFQGIASLAAGTSKIRKRASINPDIIFSFLLDQEDRFMNDMVSIR